jgi:hypothetical protein
MTTRLPLHRWALYIEECYHGSVPSPVAAPETKPTVSEPGAIVGDAVGTPLCGTCGVLFDDFVAQRSHFRSALHVENVKRVAAGKQPITCDR